MGVLGGGCWFDLGMFIFWLLNQVLYYICQSNSVSYLLSSHVADSDGLNLQESGRGGSGEAGVINDVRDVPEEWEVVGTSGIF